MITPYRGRLAPSPTGAMHFGIARTSLLAWLRARAAGGELMMRIEDLDPPRVVPGSAEAIMADLRWLGIDWDGEPWVQSQRSAHYEAALDALRAQGLLFPCTCSRKELAALSSAPHGFRELGPRYPGTCLHAPPATDRPAALRFRMPSGEPFVDELQGAQPASEGDDFVVRRSDGLYAYQLAVVVDDIAMGITEVVRGDDLLSSTPRQLALYRALLPPGARPPAFLHVPLVLSVQGDRMSKRFGSASIAAERERGVRAQAVVGKLAASLGLVPEGTECTPAELVAGFDLARVPKDQVVLRAADG